MKKEAEKSLVGTSNTLSDVQKIRWNQKQLRKKINEILERNIKESCPRQLFEELVSKQHERQKIQSQKEQGDNGRKVMHFSKNLDKEMLQHSKLNKHKSWHTFAQSDLNPIQEEKNRQFEILKELKKNLKQNELEEIYENPQYFMGKKSGDQKILLDHQVWEQMIGKDGQDQNQEQSSLFQVEGMSSRSVLDNQLKSKIRNLNQSFSSQLSKTTNFRLPNNGSNQRLYENKNSSTDSRSFLHNQDSQDSLETSHSLQKRLLEQKQKQISHKNHKSMHLFNQRYLMIQEQNEELRAERLDKIQQKLSQGAIGHLEKQFRIKKLLSQEEIDEDIIFKKMQQQKLRQQQKIESQKNREEEIEIRQLQEQMRSVILTSRAHINKQQLQISKVQARNQSQRYLAQHQY